MCTTPLKHAFFFYTVVVAYKGCQFQLHVEKLIEHYSIGLFKCFVRWTDIQRIKYCRTTSIVTVWSVRIQEVMYVNWLISLRPFMLCRGKFNLWRPNIAQKMMDNSTHPIDNKLQHLNLIDSFGKYAQMQDR